MGCIRNAKNAVLRATFGRETYINVKIGHPYISRIEIFGYIDSSYQIFLWWSDFRVKSPIVWSMVDLFDFGVNNMPSSFRTCHQSFGISSLSRDKVLFVQYSSQKHTKITKWILNTIDRPSKRSSARCATVACVTDTVQENIMKLQEWVCIPRCVNHRKVANACMSFTRTSKARFKTTHNSALCVAERHMYFRTFDPHTPLRRTGVRSATGSMSCEMYSAPFVHARSGLVIQQRLNNRGV